MKLGHYLNELQSAQSSIKERSQEISREKLEHGGETLEEVEELLIELGPFRFSRKKEMKRSSTSSLMRKELEETQSEAVDSHQVLEQRENKEALALKAPQAGKSEGQFPVWKGVNTLA